MGHSTPKWENFFHVTEDEAGDVPVQKHQCKGEDGWAAVCTSQYLHKINEALESFKHPLSYGSRLVNFIYS